jgi:hypothetical protein
MTLLRRRPAPLQRAIRRHPLLAAVVALIALGAVPSLSWQLHPSVSAAARPKADARYATQMTDRHLTRRRHLRNRTNEDVDSALETCAGLGPRYFAERYGVAADPRVVARLYAQRYEPAFQDRVYGSCLEGLTQGG